MISVTWMATIRYYETMHIVCLIRVTNIYSFLLYFCLSFKQIQSAHLHYNPTGSLLYLSQGSN